MPPVFKSDLVNKQYVDTRIPTKLAIENQIIGAMLYFDGTNWVLISSIQINTLQGWNPYYFSLVGYDVSGIVTLRLRAESGGATNDFYNDILVDNLKLDANAKFNIEVECKSEYKIIASLKRYENKITYFQTSIINNDKLLKVIFLEPLEEFVFKYEKKGRII